MSQKQKTRQKARRQKAEGRSKNKAEGRRQKAEVKAKAKPRRVPYKLDPRQALLVPRAVALGLTSALFLLLPSAFCLLPCFTSAFCLVFTSAFWLLPSGLVYPPSFV
ncbi:MAG: hypothetical protein LC732_00035, partial [Acidobacteria bacterium]|nr:hypothetical protein [Acidobacteriota bacterium]